MSVVNIINTGDAVHMFTDGGLYRDDGTIDFLANKVQICPHINAAFSFRSSFGWWHNLFIQVSRKFHSFDQMVEGILPFFLGAVWKHPDRPSVRVLYDELWFCGWSTIRNRAEVYGVGCNGFNHAVHGCEAPAHTLLRFEGSRIAIPRMGVESTSFLQGAAGTIDDLGVSLMEMQRSVPWENKEHKDVRIVAGFVQKTSVDREGITSKIIKRWDDKPGDRVGGAVALAAVSENAAAEPHSESKEGLAGLVPAAPAGSAAAGYFLKADGTWSQAGGIAQTPTWNAAVTYALGEAVIWEGSVWGALVGNTNKEPGVDAEWEFLVGAIHTGSVVGGDEGVTTTYTSHTGAGSVIPADNTTPLVSEGVAAASVNYTARQASGKIKVRFSIPIGTTAATINYLVATVFKDSVCIGVVPFNLPSGGFSTIAGEVALATAGDTTMHTYSVRVGQSASGNTFFLNGGSVAIYNGMLKSVISVSEIKQ